MNRYKNVLLASAIAAALASAPQAYAQQRKVEVAAQSEQHLGIGGLDPKYSTFTIDGARTATATSNNNTGRQNSFEQMSITGIEAIELNNTLTARMDADSPGGTINLRSKAELLVHAGCSAWARAVGGPRRTFQIQNRELRRARFLCYQADMQLSFARYWFYFSYPEPLAEGLTSI